MLLKKSILIVDNNQNNHNRPQSNQKIFYTLPQNIYKEYNFEISDSNQKIVILLMCTF